MSLLIAWISEVECLVVVTGCCPAHQLTREEPTMDTEPALQDFRDLADRFAADRHDRQRRNELDAADFEQLAAAGFLLTGVSTKAGGMFESVPRSTRAVTEILRVLAQGDSSVALVASMHPAVLSLWLATDEVPGPYQAGWAEQRELLGELAKTNWFGTITSEPGSGGDVSQSRAVARPGADGGGCFPARSTSAVAPALPRSC